MTRRSFLVAIGCVLLLAGTISTAVILLLRFEPAQFRNAPLPGDEAGASHSKADFLREFSDLHNALKSDGDWYAKFTDEQINSAFAPGGLAEKLLPLPEGISDPRVTFESNRLWICFRYKSGVINTVVSVCLRIWLPRSEANAVALQMEGVHAGLIPFSAQWLLEHLSETARQNGAEVNWYRHESRPVAVVRFQADQAHPTLQLKAVQIDNNSITIHGKSSGTQAAVQGNRPALAAR